MPGPHYIMYVDTLFPDLFFVWVRQWYWIPKRGPCTSEWELYSVSEPNGYWWGRLSEWNYQRSCTLKGSNSDSVTNYKFLVDSVTNYKLLKTCKEWRPPDGISCAAKGLA